MSELVSTPKLNACHVYVRKIAMEMTACVYEEAARDDNFYKQYPDQKAFINKYWPMHVHAARETLAKMLGQPESQVSELMKEKILDIILKDRSLQTLTPVGTA